MGSSWAARLGVGAGAGARRQAQPTQRTGDGSGGGDAGELALLDAEAHPSGHTLGDTGVVVLADGGLASGGAGAKTIGTVLVYLQL